MTVHGTQLIFGFRPGNSSTKQLNGNSLLLGNDQFPIQPTEILVLFHDSLLPQNVCLGCNNLLQDYWKIVQHLHYFLLAFWILLLEISRRRPRLTRITLGRSRPHQCCIDCWLLLSDLQPKHSSVSQMLFDGTPMIISIIWGWID